MDIWSAYRTFNESSSRGVNMAITKDDVYTVLDHMVSCDYPDREDGGSMDEVAEHISSYIEANIDDFLEMYNEED